jgi:hypothetical protein
MKKKKNGRRLAMHSGWGPRFIAEGIGRTEGLGKWKGFEDRKNYKELKQCNLQQNSKLHPASAALF